MTYRIAVAGLHTECSTYNPVLAREADFRVVRGAALLAHPYFAFLKDYAAHYLPLLHARAIAGGPVEAAIYESWKAEILAGLATSVPLDGVYLAMHGAMYIEGMEDAEGDFIAAVRAVVGSECLITVSYDLHGNLSQRIVDNIDMFSTYRTAPHIDVEETMRRAIAMLHRALECGERPGIIWAPVPVLLPGERTSTEDEPAKSFYTQLPRIEEPDGIWDASFQVGYVWADEPRATAAAILTGTDRAAMDTAAKALAAKYWAIRNDFVFGMETDDTEELVVRALGSKTRPVIIAESGDNPTGGGVGDRAEVLATLLAMGVSDTIFAGIADRAATEAAYKAGVGGRVHLSIGATLDPASAPVETDVIVRFLLPTDSTDRGEAVVRIGGVDLVLTAYRRPFHNIADFTRLGLDPRKAHIVVVKSGYLSPDLAPIANPGLMALSPGVVDQFVERLDIQRTTRPTYPFDTDFDFVAKAHFSERIAAK